MGMVRTADEGTTYAATDESGQPLGVPALSRRSVLASSSATMFVRGVDKAGMFPPPIKVITRYTGVSHARIFGTHLFGVDFANAERGLLGFLGRKNESMVGSYSEGCQFFHDYQREFLLMPAGLSASVTGVFVYSPDLGHCVMLTSERHAAESLRPIGFLDVPIQIAGKNSAKFGARRDRCKEFCNAEMEDRECCERLLLAFENPPSGVSLGERFNAVTQNAVIMHEVELVKRSMDPVLAGLKGQIEAAERVKAVEDNAAAERKVRKQIRLTPEENTSKNAALQGVVDACLAVRDTIRGRLLEDLMDKRKQLHAIVARNEFTVFLEAKS
jgi:hypothetical protein